MYLSPTRWTHVKNITSAYRTSVSVSALVMPRVQSIRRMIHPIEESAYGAKMLLMMNTKELQKLETIQNVGDKRIKKIDASKILNLSRKHIQRLVNQY